MYISVKLQFYKHLIYNVRSYFKVEQEVKLFFKK